MKCFNMVYRTKKRKDRRNYEIQNEHIRTSALTKVSTVKVSRILGKTTICTFPLKIVSKK